MKKATGKVVSLVLALALVITSFSATFAFAATETGEATIHVDSHKELYLANTNGVKDAGDNVKQVNLTDLLLTNSENPVTLETYDHEIIEDVEITQVTVSGDNIVRVSKERDGADEGDYIMTVRNASGSGDATLNVLFQGTFTRDDDDDETTVRGSAQIKVHLLDAKTPILGKTGAEDKKPGDGVDSLDTLEKNAMTSQHDEDDQDEPRRDVQASASVYLPTTSADSALAQYKTTKLYSTFDKVTADTIDVDNSYFVEVTGSKSYLTMTEGGDSFTYGIEDPSVGNSLRVTISSIEELEENAETPYDTDQTKVRTTLRVENKVVTTGNITIDQGDGSKATVNGDASTTLSKSKTYVEIGDEYWDVTGAAVSTDGSIDMYNGRVGNLSGTTITVDDGTVGDIDASNNVTLNGGTVGDVDSDLAVMIAGATVESISAAGNGVTVESGRVNGDVSASSVMLDPANEEESVSVGNVSAVSLTVNGIYGQAAAGNFTATDWNSTVTLQGNNASIGSLDFDYWDTDLILDGFVGTVSAPTSATNGASIISQDDPTETDASTNATVSGNVNISEIALEEGQVTFAGSVRVANVAGGEATMVINAGALEISETVSTSNTLKLADAADVVGGTVVYRAASDIADESSFIGYGYSVRMVSGSSQDAFVIDDTYFAGLTMNVASADILLGTSETFTASAYPVNTTLPEGAYIKFFLDGDENYISGVDNGNGTATIQALKYDSTFSSLNEATLTAYVYDEYDIELEEYGSATLNLRVIEKPATTYVSDTTGNVDVAVGNTYQFKITSTDGSVPSFAVAGDGNIFRLVEQSNSGNDYFFKVQAVGTPGQVCGVYINREATPVATLTVGANFTCDTTTVNVAVGASYIAKVTANEQPVVAAGNSSYTVELASQSGNDYFFRITAVSAQVGDQVGFYINSSAAPVFIATTV